MFVYCLFVLTIIFATCIHVCESDPGEIENTNYFMPPGFRRRVTRRRGVSVVIFRRHPLVKRKPMPREIDPNFYKEAMFLRLNVRVRGMIQFVFGSFMKTLSRRDGSLHYAIPVDC